MKVSYTHIVGVSSDEGSVEIMFRQRGSDEADAPRVIRVSPHIGYIHISLSGFGDDGIKYVDRGFNIAEIHLEKGGK